MQFIYHHDGGDTTLQLSGDIYKHLFKSRRQREAQILQVRNLKDCNLYKYEVTRIEKNSATLQLIDYTKKIHTPLKNFTLGWCIVEPKIIEKTLPMLNEIGVSKIAFVYGDYTQKNYKLDFDRLRKILINSCQQCGRALLMEFSLYASIQEYLQEYPQSFFLDFGGKSLDNFTHINSILIGSEGGFSQQERELFVKKSIIGFDSPFILKSQSAACAISAKILL